MATLSYYDRAGLWEAHGKKCAYCGDPLPFRELDVDHIIPESARKSESEWESTRSELGLPFDFNVNSLSNFLPAHHHCNLKKSDILLDPARAHFFLTLADNKVPSVGRYAATARLNNQLGRLMEAIKVQLESGNLGADQLLSLDLDPSNIRLSTPVWFGEEPKWSISREDVDNLLEMQLPGGSEFTDGCGNFRIVRSCKDYRAAINDGLFAYHKMDGAFFVRTEATLKVVSAAKIPSVSHVNAPRAGVADLHLLPKTLLPQIGPAGVDLIGPIREKSLRDLLQARKITVVGVSSRELTFEWEYNGAHLRELLRADLDNDGIEDILIEHYTYAVHGSIGFSTIGLLRRPEADSMFQYVPSWP